MLHKKIFTREQNGLLPLVKLFSPDFSLVGGTAIAEKLFRAQLSYFKDIDFSEKVIYLKGFKTDDKTVKKGLIEFSIE